MDASISITVQDGNSSPTIVAPGPILSVDEDQPIGTLLSSMEGLFTDGLQNDPITLVITSVLIVEKEDEPQPGQFVSSIGNAIGFQGNFSKALTALTTQGLLDHERISIFKLAITATDNPTNNPAGTRPFIGKSVEGIFTVTINDINEVPGINVEDSLGSLHVHENSPAEVTVGDVQATDPDTDTVLTFSLVKRPEDTVTAAAAELAPFSVFNRGNISSDANNNRARISVVNSLPLNFEATKNTFSFMLKADDGVLFAVANIQVTVDDVREPPTLSNKQFSIVENTADWEICMVLQDDDAGNSFSLVDQSVGLNYWTIYTRQSNITTAPGVSVVQNNGEMTWTITIDAQTLDLTVGMTVTQDSASGIGTISQVINGETITLTIRSDIGQTFDASGELIISVIDETGTPVTIPDSQISGAESTTVEHATGTLKSYISNPQRSQIEIDVTAGAFDTETDIIINGTTTIVANNVHDLTNVLIPSVSELIDVRSPGCVFGISPFNFEVQEIYNIEVRVVDDEIPAFTSTATLSLTVLDVMDTEVNIISPVSLPTLGGVVTLEGKDIGPSSRKLAAMASDEARKNATTFTVSFKTLTGSFYEYFATDCTNLIPGSKITCLLPAGAGIHFSWVLKMGPLDTITTDRTLVFTNIFGYDFPIVTSVTFGEHGGDGLLSTSGNTSILLTGTSFGPTTFPSADITVKYARDLATTKQGGYLAVNCKITVAHTNILCKSSPGIGRDLEFWISSLFGSYSNILTDSGNLARHQLPIITNVKVKPGTLAAVDRTFSTLPTVGGTPVLIFGENFGPISTSVSNVFTTSEKSSIVYGIYTATDCKVLIAQTTIECKTSSGIGANHSWKIIRGDQPAANASTFLTSYAPPSILSVSGNAIRSVPTTGGARVVVSGIDLGKTVNEITITYGPYQMNSVKKTARLYRCTNIQIIVASKSISCFMSDGTGAGHAMVLTVHGQVSNVLLDQISYGAPVVTLFQGPGASNANTDGHQLVLLDGTNFGKAGLAISKIDQVLYGKNSDPFDKWYDATSTCTITISHIRIACETIPGFGKELRWVLKIDGQMSTTSTTNYAPPTVTGIFQTDGVTAITDASANGDVTIVLLGKNFGPVGFIQIDAITFGPQGRQFIAKDCNITIASTRMVCKTPPSIGQDLQSYVTIGGQTSLTSSAKLSFAAPIVEVTSSLLVDTRGQSISFTGTNYGLKIEDLTTRAVFGAKILVATETEQLEPNGKDQVKFDFPPLIDMLSPFSNIETYLEVSTGIVTMQSNTKLLAYARPVIDKIFTYEGISAALRIVLAGNNFCGSLDCGSIDALDIDGNKKVPTYLNWNHDRVEFEINAAKGSFRVAVGSEFYSYQYSNFVLFEHKSPVVDNKEVLSSVEHPTEGGTLITVEGRFMRMQNVEIWIGGRKGQVVLITQDEARGPQYYTVICKVPPGQGKKNELFVRLSTTSAGVASDSEPASLNYMSPSNVVMTSHHFPTTGGVAEFFGNNLGICAFLMMDGNVYGDECTNVTDHTMLKMNVPDGDGTDHVLSLSMYSASGTLEVLNNGEFGWLPVGDQCNSGKGLQDRFGWFEYDAPVVTAISPAISETVGKTTVTITGKNFGVFNGRDSSVLKVQMLSRKKSGCNNCNAALKSACTAGFGCTASSCCSENPGCGCFENSCNCCSLASNCHVISYTHTSITCEIEEGQGIDLEIVVNVLGQTSSGSTATFAYEPPTISSLVLISNLDNTKQQSNASQSNDIYARTTGGDLYQMNGTSFGTSGAMIELIGDDKTTGPLSQTLGPFPIVSQTHTSVIFRLPPGHGQGRHVKLIVGEQSNIFVSNTFNYIKPTLTKIEQPEPCTTISRTTSCGSPTIGGFKMTLHGDNFGPLTSTTATILTIGGIQCCNSCATIVGQENECSCCIESRDHTSITIIAPAYNSDGEYLFESSNIPVELKYNYLDWNFFSTITYDAPWINYVNPQTGNAQGQEVSIHGINFGHASGMNVEKIRIGNVTCNNTRWTGRSADDEAISCYLPMDRVGPKTVAMTVAGQTSIWDKSEWLLPTGKRVYSTSCPVDFYGRDGEYCFECPFARTQDGNPLIDRRGDKDYLGKCIGGDNDPTAKKGFYKIEVKKECGNTGFPCSKTMDCFNYSKHLVTEDGIETIDPGTCSITHVKGAEYCNQTILETRDYCSYILPCDPPESCKAANLCSVVAEEEKDPITKVNIRPHGYSNKTNGAKYVTRCTACASGYFRVGGLCEPCPKDVKLIAVLFICGIISACVVGYIMNRYKVNLAIAAIGIDYAQILSMFLKSQIPWPSQLRTLFRILSSFNFDLDIASPECLVAGLYRFDIKWFCIMAMPLCVAVVFMCTHFCIVIKKRIKGRTQKLNKHAHAMVSMNLVMMYFLYLYVTRSALDVFNCTPLDPPDPIHPEYTYMTAIGGELCYQEGGLQMSLIPYAICGIIFYTIGYPCLLGWLFWKNKNRIQRDQYLRAMRADVVRDITDKFNIYNIRKRYSHLYYQFKPRSYYWTVVIIARKFSVAFINLMLRQNIEYMLAASLLVMFVALLGQVHIQPYMGPAEHLNVLKKWGERTKALSSGRFSDFTFPTNLDEEKKPKQLNQKKNRRRNTSRRIIQEKIKSSGTKCGQKLVNYNVVESVLLTCAVLIMLAGIMFSSDRFENNKNKDELAFLTWLTLIIVAGSLGYYALVLSLEVSAQVCPVYCKKSWCDLEKHFGETYTSRHLRKKKKKKKSISVSKDSSTDELGIQLEMTQNLTMNASSSKPLSNRKLLPTALSSSTISRKRKKKKKKKKKKQDDSLISEDALALVDEAKSSKATDPMITNIAKQVVTQTVKHKKTDSFFAHKAGNGSVYYESADNPGETLWKLPKGAVVLGDKKAKKKASESKEETLMNKGNESPLPVWNSHRTEDGKVYFNNGVRSTWTDHAKTSKNKLQ